MEYVDGPSCADMLREHKQLDVDETVRIVRDACHGLDYAHRAGVVHRDVKPGNLLVADETGTTKLADFGIAKAAEQTRITQVGSVLGTAAYLSPEQARGEEAGPASDIYSLGVCAYQFLAGRLPHEYVAHRAGAQAAGGDRGADHGAPARGAGRARPRDPVCLAREPAARYPTTLDMARALDAGAQGDVTDATRRLAAADPDATRALGDVTAATQALRTRRAPAPAPIPQRRTATGVREPDPRKERRARRARRLGTFLAVLAALMAVAAVVLALNASNGGGGIDPIDGNSVDQQIDDLKQFLRDNTR